MVESDHIFVPGDIVEVELDHVGDWSPGIFLQYARSHGSCDYANILLCDGKMHLIRYENILEIKNCQIT